MNDLAAASEDEVLRLWEGLGYYSRARNLHAAARQIVGLGHFPDTLEGIRALKGVGDYTAAAIGSIAFGIPAAVVDGNVYRVLARFFGIATEVGTPAAKKEFTSLAQSLLPPERAADFNQGMMDFGAMQCTPASPACAECPLRTRCKAFQGGLVDKLPVKKAPAEVRTRRLAYIYVRCGGMTPVRHRGAGDIWQGLWEPLVYEDAPLPRFDGTLTLLRRQVRHQLTHRLLLADFYLLETTVRPELPDGYVWIREEELDGYGKPRLFKLLLEAV